MILCDTEILELAEAGMITPFLHEQVGRGDGFPSSIGPSPYSYDIRLGEDFIFYAPSNEALDLAELETPKEDYWEVTSPDGITMPPKGFVLAVSVEEIHMPDDVTAFLCDKSSLARKGVTIQNTLMDAGWKGQITLEITNHRDRPVILRPGMGIGQLVFFRGRPCALTYADLKGKYMGQRGVTLPR